MKGTIRIALALCALAIFSATALAQEAPAVSAKKDIAVFALGYTGWEMSAKDLGSVDLQINKVFAAMGRFTVIGQAQRLSMKDVDLFIKTLKKAKEASFKLPDEFAFGEKAFTEADFERLVGAFIIVIPVVTDFSVKYEENIVSGYYYHVCRITTSFTFIEASTGRTLGLVEVKSEGSDKDERDKAVAAAVERIPEVLEYEVRKIPAFALSSRILTISGGTVKIELGKDMGIMAGDEFFVVGTEDVGGVEETKDIALLVVTSVGSKVSTANVIYADEPIAVGMSIREAPKFGVDSALSLSFAGYFAKSAFYSGSAIIFDLRGEAWRGSYPLKIVSGLEFNFDGEVGAPVILTVGAGYDINFGRIFATASASVGLGSCYFATGEFLSYVGIGADLSVGYMISQDFRVFLKAGAEYYLSVGYQESYGLWKVGISALFRP